MSGIARLPNLALEELGFNEWGQRDVIPHDLNGEIVEGNQYFPPDRIPMSKIGDLRVDRITITATGYVKGGQTDYNTGTGFWMGYHPSTLTYRFSLGDSSGNKLLWDGSTLSITGTITATTGTIGGFDIGTNYIRDTANTFGLSSNVVSVSPDTIGSLIGWWKADNIPVNNGDPVETWRDVSSSGNDGIQSGSECPTFVTNVINGYPVVRFDGSNDSLLITEVTTMRHYFVVVK